MKKFIVGVLGAFALLFNTCVLADIYKCTGDGGTPTFVDGKTKANYKNCQLMMRDNGSKVVASNSKSPTPSNFPNVDKQTQNLRDDKRKEILLSELNTEQKSLETAKNQQVQSEIELHTKNIELLKKEVSALK
jgi:hypothetical protein